MPDSTSKLPHSYVLDTNVLSLFAKINRLNLLRQVVTIPLFITPAIREELSDGLKNGVSYLNDVLVLIDAGELQMLSLSGSERQFMDTLPAKLAKGEGEAIACCRNSSLTLITHDRKAINYCEREEIDCIRLTTLVEQFHEAGLLTADEIQKMFS